MMQRVGASQAGQQVGERQQVGARQASRQVSEKQQAGASQAGQQVSEKQQAGASQAGQQVSEKRSARTRHFRDLLVWQKAMTLAKDVYRHTAAFPDVERFGITNQMRRAAVSVPSNIAEGHGRLSDGNLRVFLGQARGSLYELETQIELASDLNYLHSNRAKELMELSCEVGKMLNGLIAVLNR